MKNGKRLIALLLSATLAFTFPSWEKAKNVEARGLPEITYQAPRLKGAASSRRLSNGDPWLDTELKANI